MRTYFYPSTQGLIYVEDQGVGNPLICLHGLGGGAYFFRGLGQRLQKQCRVIAIDLPGTGKSRAFPAFDSQNPSITPFTMERCLDVLEEIIKPYGPGTVSILGHSLGTMLALKLNARASIKLRSLILVGGLPKVTELIRTKLLIRAREIHAEGMHGLGYKAIPGIFAKKFLNTNPETVALFASLLEANPMEVYLQCLDELLNTDATDSISKLSLPYILITGTEDQYAPPTSLKAFSTCPSNWAKTLELPDCGHMPFLESPEGFSQAIRDFLMNLDALSSSRSQPSASVAQ